MNDVKGNFSDPSGDIERIIFAIHGHSPLFSTRQAARGSGYNNVDPKDEKENPRSVGDGITKGTTS